jgi:hypothetical protein
MRYSSSGSHRAVSMKKMGYDSKRYTNYTVTETLKLTQIVYMLAYKKLHSRLKGNIFDILV